MFGGRISGSCFVAFCALVDVFGWTRDRHKPQRGESHKSRSKGAKKTRRRRTKRPSHDADRKSTDESKTPPKPCACTRSGGLPMPTTSAPTNPATRPVPYVIVNGELCAWNVDDPAGSKRLCVMQPGLLHIVSGTHVSALPVSKHPVKDLAGVPTEKRP